MSEINKYIPDDIQLQIADDDGMSIFETKREMRAQDTQMTVGIDYELIQKEVAEWEGMRGVVVK